MEGWEEASWESGKDVYWEARGSIAPVSKSRIALASCSLPSELYIHPYTNRQEQAISESKVLSYHNQISTLPPLPHVIST